VAINTDGGGAAENYIATIFSSINLTTLIVIAKATSENTG
jgi:hypothetical protein